MTRLFRLCAKPRPFLALLMAALLLASAMPTGATQTVTPEAWEGGVALTNRPVRLDPEARLQYGQRLLDEAVGVKNRRKQALGHRIIASAHQDLRHYQQAVQHFRAALRLHRQLRNVRNATVDQLYLGEALLSQGDSGQARQQYQAALRGFTRLRYPVGVARVQGGLGQLYAQQKKWGQALACQARALEQWQRSADSGQVATTLNAIGAAYAQQQQFSRALYYLHQALRAAAPTDSLPRSESLAGIGQVYLSISNAEAALQSFNQAERIFPHSGPALRQLMLYRNIAAAYDSLSNWSVAEQVLRRSLPLARSSGSKAQLGAVYQALAENYRQMGRYRQSLDAMARFAGLQDSVFAEERSAQVAELRTRYETEKKEREIQLLTKDRQIQEATLRRQKLLRNALAAGALLLLVLVAVLYRGWRQQGQVNKLLERKNAAINRQKEELKRLNRTKDTLFSVISHDLRSPLSSLYSLLSLLNMGSLPPERLALHSARLTRGLNNTLLLLDNLLNWSAAQMKDDKIRPEKVRLDVLAEESVALLLGDAERKAILLLNQLPVPTPVRADVNMMRLVLRNLLGNAIKFTPEGGSVTITAARHGTLWAVAVHDTGIGIRATDHDKLFGKDGPFSTLGTAREKGTGLGLQLCKDFVERNGGQLTFTSQVGQGTTFTFTLPAATPQPADAPEACITAAAAAE